MAQRRFGGENERYDVRERLREGRKLVPRLLTLALPFKSRLITGFLALAAASGISLLFPYIIREALNGTLGIELPEDTARLALLLIALFAVQAVFFYIRHYSFAIAGHLLVADLRTKLFEHLVVQDTQFFDRNKTGDLLSRLSSDTQALQAALTVNVSVALRYALQVIGGVILLLMISVSLSLIILLVIPIILLFSRAWGMKLGAASRTMQAELGSAAAVAEEALSANRVVKIFSGERREAARYRDSLTRFMEAAFARTRIAARFSSVMVFILHSSIAIALWAGVGMVQSGALTVGDLTAFVLYCAIVAVSFGFLFSAFDEFMHAVGAAHRIFEVLDSVPKIEKTLSSTAEVESGARAYGIGEPLVRFDQVHFRYPSRPEVDVLRGITFDILAGHSVALVGPSGSGKSTVAALLTRLYDPTKGEIQFRGTPLKEWNVSALRSEISAVSQDSQVFSLSVTDNIAYSLPRPSEEETNDALAVANLSSFVDTLPQRGDTIVGERGTQVSGGQRQRLAIARALLKPASLLILDEATSALDSENERQIFDAIRNRQGDQAMLVIAHRLSTIQHCDKIFVLQDGVIVQRGTHESLMNTAGLYKTLVEYQLL